MNQTSSKRPFVGSEPQGCTLLRQLPRSKGLPRRRKTYHQKQSGPLDRTRISHRFMHVFHGARHRPASVRDQPQSRPRGWRGARWDTATATRLVTTCAPTPAEAAPTAARPLLDTARVQAARTEKVRRIHHRRRIAGLCSGHGLRDIAGCRSDRSEVVAWTMVNEHRRRGGCAT